MRRTLAVAALLACAPLLLPAVARAHATLVEAEPGTQTRLREAPSLIRLRFTEPAGLWEPPVNITLGAHYLAQLRARFREPLLAVASYNAGPHRVQKWQAERPRADLDEFVDQIPFDETRAFVKRVATSWHHYRRLYGP